MTSILSNEVSPSVRATTSLVDCDVHTNVPSEQVMADLLPEKWRDYFRTFGPAYASNAYPRAVKNAARVDTWPPSGGLPASNLSFMRKQLLDEWGIGCAILGPLKSVAQSGLHNPEFAAAVSSAVNDWTASEWLAKEERLAGSIVTPYEDSDLAVAEIERLAPNRRFVQIYLLVRTSRPLGNRKYWPIYEAAVRNDLPVGIHFGGGNSNPITAAGWPSYYLEDHSGNAQSFQDQVISLVCEGVFERFPALKIVLIEGGVSWLPPLAWRLDRAFERLHRDVPHLQRNPSEYIIDNIWMTTQPIVEPKAPYTVRDLVESFPMFEDRLMFSTDYPHWDFDAPNEALRKSRLPQETLGKIFHENAQKLYRL